MSERERWIVYPLLFFALGAAIRDKILREVRTDRMAADTIQCERIAIVDPTDPRRILGELSSTMTQTAGTGEPRRVGRLVLTDSEGREYFGLADDLLQMRDIRCEGISVVDPDDATKILAQLTSASIPPLVIGGRPTRFGMLALNNQRLFGLSTRGAPAGQLQIQLPQEQGSGGAAEAKQNGPASEAENRAGDSEIGAGETVGDQNSQPEPESER